MHNILSQYIAILLCFVNTFSFILCVYDKLAAKNGKRRISERTLLYISALFGSFGMLVGMYTARHKTKHAQFVICVPLFAVIHVVILFLYF